MNQERRLKRLREALEKEHLDALLITNPYNRRYMTGFTGSAGMVLISRTQALLFTDFRYRTQAPMEAKGYAVVEQTNDPLREMIPYLQKENIKRLGFEKHHVPYGNYLKFQDVWGQIVQLVPTENIVENLRMIKDTEELEILREAANLADRTFEHILQHIRPGVSEREIALEMEFFMRKNKATSSSFDIIVASGERSALPHGVASEKILKHGEFVKLDFGAYYKGYCSDITRTVMLGKPTEKHREIYEIVLEAQQTALSAIKPGMTGKEVDALARETIERYGYGSYFGHGTGHGLGLEIHEAPRLSKLSDIVLKPGMAVTVEPGIYLPGFGGVRIEDDIVITEKGVEVITHAAKEWTVLN